jgi:hypothetical protein
MSRLTPSLLTVPRPCIKCGSRNARLGDNRQLRCAQCGDDRGQLSEQISRFLAGVKKHFGEPTEIVARRKSTAPPTATSTPNRSAGLQSGVTTVKQ